MTNFQERTNKLKKIITKTQKSAKQAWEAGSILREIRNNQAFKPQYDQFKEYTKKEFNITHNTAEQYIKIHEKIPLEMITDNMLVSHLYTIAEMKNDLRYKVLETMRWAEENIKSKDKIPYDGDVVLVIKQIVECAKENALSDDILQEIFQAILSEDLKETKRKARDKKNPLEEAIPIYQLTIHESFKNILSLYSYAPISEQGLVGLFCTIFHILRDKIINYEGKEYNFYRIVYVRVEFPDALIELKKYIKPDCSSTNQDDLKEPNSHHIYPEYLYSGSLSSEVHIEVKKLDYQGSQCTSPRLKQIYVEFELDSFNYWRHKHHEAAAKCDMIICWEIGKSFKEINMPPILSIRELIETGKINLHDSNKE